MIPADKLMGLPEEVVNELAILEDRAIRAEEKAERLDRRNASLHDEIEILRQTVDEQRTFIEELKTRAESAVDDIERRLQHLVATQAS